MFFKTIDFSTYSSIKVGQPTEVMILEKGDEIPQDRYLIGGANNLLVSPTPPPLMKLGKDFAAITQEEGILTIGAATPTGRIVSYARKHNIAGFEFCAKLPGTLGGMLAMNAGVKEYEIFNILHSVKINGRWVNVEDIEHGYRYAKLGSIAIEARFEIREGFSQTLLDTLLSWRSNQPPEPSAGSVFKNPDGDYAGRLIEAAGLIGARKGEMQWSPIHANFLVNLGNGTFEDALYLITLAKKEVKKLFGITLQEEIKIL
ncbi:MAG: UDP-N-acetylmuramate dehydrogenase [Sulfurovum sp.]|nr:UDP-N-acetylmuramate dehydrogenase [Sulfurovum sp.]MDD3499966.1 UDP-N-acetylmuramate dehydrogenase [Sulfurovum sp.]